MDLQPSSKNFFQNLPNEIILNIFKNLELKFLVTCARVCCRWNNISKDHALYKNLTITNEEAFRDDEVLKFFIKQGQVVKKLKITSFRSHPLMSLSLTHFLQRCCQEISHLDLSLCMFVNVDSLTQIGKCKKLQSLQLRGGMFLSHHYGGLEKLTNLVRLHLKQTRITTETLTNILIANPKLKHLNLDCAMRILDMKSVLSTAAKNNKKLTSFSCGTFKFSTDLIFDSLQFPNLKTLDLVLCSTPKPKEFFQKMTEACPNLETLNLTCWRDLDDLSLLPIISELKHLKHLILKNVCRITGFICEEALKNLSKLQSLNIDLCDIDDVKIEEWRKNYPEVTISSWSYMRKKTSDVD